MAPLLHPPGPRWAETARALAGAPGLPAEARPMARGEREEAARGPGLPGAWCLLPAGDLRGATLPPEGALVLPRPDPRWTVEDLARRPLDRIPPGTGVVVASDLGEALLHRARPDLLPLRAGRFPAPEETPVLAAGPREGVPGGEPLDAKAFVPEPWTGLRLLLAPRGEAVPEEARVLEDGAARSAMEMEEAFRRGVGDLPPGAALGALASRKVSVLFGLRAVLFVPGEAPRDLDAEVPLRDARQFARAFGAHLAGLRTKGEKKA